MYHDVILNPQVFPSFPCRFRVKTVVVPDTATGRILHVNYIYVADSQDIPVLITHLQDYVTSTLTLPDFYASSQKKNCLFFCDMLNFILVERREYYGISSVFQITHDMMQEYFTDYAMEVMEDGDRRLPATAWECVRACTFTMNQIVLKHGDKMVLKSEELVVPKKIRDYHGRTKISYVPNFTAHGGDMKTQIYREIPTEALEVLITVAFKHAPDIVFALCLQAFAGLRPSEACNVRQECSPYGPGIEYVMGSQGILYPQIDLRKELVLRSDRVDVGGIKKERVQQVYPAFIEAFNVVYEWHKERLSYRVFEKEYAPMFVNKRGKALTYHSYRYKFDTLVKKHFIPALLSSESVLLQQYGKVIQERKLSPHSLRHAYTVQLVLRGVTPAELMYWRGDTCIDSSATYVSNKGELVALAKQVGEDFTEHIVSLGRRCSK